MKMVKLLPLIILFLLNTFIISGCWNYREIDEMSIVAGAAVDYDIENDLFVLTAELIYPSASEREIKVLSEIITDTGKNFFDAVRTMIRRAGIRLFWGHVKILVISENIANDEKRLLSVIDFLYRDAEIRNDIHLIIAKDKDPQEILKADIKVETITSFYLKDAFENEKSISKYHAVPLWKFVDNLNSRGISPTLPTVTTIKQKDKTIGQISGSGVFKEGELVGYIDGDETKSYMFIIGEIKGGVLVVDKYIEGEFSRVTLEIIRNNTKVTPIYSDEKLTMNIEIEVSVVISEIQGQTNFMDEKYTKSLEDKAQKQLKNQVDLLIKKVQKNFKADIFGFGTIVESEMPNLWNEVKYNWSDYFKELKTQTNVIINIEGSSLRSKPIKVGE